MKAMILAAGLGERMRPLTNTTPKPLLRAGGRALIDYHLAACARAGVHDIVINHSWLGAQIEQHIGSGEKFGVRVQYSPEVTPLETLGGIVQALPLLCPDAAQNAVKIEVRSEVNSAVTSAAQSDAPFLVINADIWTDFDLSALVTTAFDTPKIMAQLVLVDNPPQHPHGDFALDNGYARARENVEHSNVFTFAGIALYRPEFFAGCRPGKAPLAPLLRARMAEQLVGAQKYNGRWFDIGTPERLQALDHLLMTTVSATQSLGVHE